MEILDNIQDPEGSWYLFTELIFEMTDELESKDTYALQFTFTFSSF